MGLRALCLRCLCYFLFWIVDAVCQVPTAPLKELHALRALYSLPASKLPLAELRALTASQLAPLKATAAAAATAAEEVTADVTAAPPPSPNPDSGAAAGLVSLREVAATLRVAKESLRPAPGVLLPKGRYPLGDVVGVWREKVLLSLLFFSVCLRVPFPCRTRTSRACRRRAGRS